MVRPRRNTPFSEIPTHDYSSKVFPSSPTFYLPYYPSTSWKTYRSRSEPSYRFVHWCLWEFCKLSSLETGTYGLNDLGCSTGIFAINRTVLSTEEHSNDITCKLSWRSGTGRTLWTKHVSQDSTKMLNIWAPSMFDNPSGSFRCPNAFIFWGSKRPIARRHSSLADLSGHTRRSKSSQNQKERQWTWSDD